VLINVLFPAPGALPVIMTSRISKPSDLRSIRE
jgi:hypothetical protein